MKKFISLFLSLAMLFSLSACGNSSNNEEGAADKDNKFEIAMVTDYGSVDDKSFNQGAWEGVTSFAKDNEKSYKYYRPTEKSTDAYLDAIQMAVSNGAKIIICPGFLFEPAVFKAQDTYPDVKFIILDGVPQDGTYTEFKTANNTYSILYSEEQSGFLAGYAVVKDGYRSLGFLGGMAVPAVVKFGYGYLQGAEYAAKELGLAPGSVTVKYGYTGGFDPMPEYQTKAASWYQSGTEVIFSCAALVLNNVTAAAEAAGDSKYVIGVDVDQKGESETVITSAMKYLGKTVYDSLNLFYKDQFPGGQNVVLGVAEGAVGLPEDFSRMKKFNEEMYKDILKKLVENKDNIETSIIKDTDSKGNKVTFNDIKSKLSIVNAEEVS